MELLLLLLLLVPFMLVVFILIMGPTTHFRNGPLGHAFWFITEDLPEMVSRGFKRMIGRRLSRVLGRCCSCLFETAHPTMQIIFAILLVGALYIFFTEGWIHLPNPQVPAYHRYLIPPAVAMLIFSFGAASFVDPGRITERNVDRACQIFPYDYVLFFPKECQTCDLAKPARSKHCSLCKGCISRSDHHCVWVNNCIGHLNHRYFLLFLHSLVGVCLYGAYLVYGLFTHLAFVRGISGLVVLDEETRGPRRITRYESFVHLLHQEAALGALGLFAGIVAVVVGIFTVYQVYCVCAGPTANEACKWDDIRSAVAEGRLYRVDRDEEGWEERVGPMSGAPEDETEGMRQRKGAGGEGRQVQVMDASTLPNIYDRGSWGNLMSVLFPEPLNR